MAARKPKVALIGTGGTISSVGRDSLDLYDYPEFGSKLEPDQLVTKFPEVAMAAEINAIRFRSVGSPDVGISEWLELVGMIHDLANDPDLAGVVITHGTATLEETAYFLNLTVKAPVTVVLVGAQRPSSAISTDAAINLRNAVRVAADPKSRGMGVLVVLNDEIQAAREVTKTSTFRMQTFRTPDFGVLGQADGDAVVFYRQPLRRRAPDTEFDISGRSELPRVDIAYAYAGGDAVAIEAFVAAGAKGIVSAGMAPGTNTKAQYAALELAVKRGVAVIMSSRVGSGRVINRAGLRQKGLIGADNLNPQKARILLMLALSKTRDPAEIERMFAEY